MTPDANQEQRATIVPAHPDWYVLYVGATISRGPIIAWRIVENAGGIECCEPVTPAGGGGHYVAIVGPDYFAGNDGTLHETEGALIKHLRRLPNAFRQSQTIMNRSWSAG